MRNIARTCGMGLLMLAVTTSWAQDAVPSLTAEEAAWLEANPDAIVDLSQMPPGQLQKFAELYQGLTPEEQQQLRDSAGELQALSPDEQAWALDNPTAVGKLGKLSPAERERLLQLYRQADPATQQRLRKQAQ